MKVEVIKRWDKQRVRFYYYVTIDGEDAGFELTETDAVKRADVTLLKANENCPDEVVYSKNSGE